MAATLIAPDEVRLGEVDRRGPDYVRWVQQSLNRLTGSRIKVDGVLGAQTRAAVQAFQRRRGLVADGVVGPSTESALVAAGAGPPSRPAAAGPPALVKRDDRPPALTLYLGIKLGGEGRARPLTGVFIPPGYRLPRTATDGPAVDLILWLRGFHREEPSEAIDRYWDAGRRSDRAFREGVNQSGKNVLLVAPTLGPRSEAGSLVRRGGLDAYLDRVLSGLSAHGPAPFAGRRPVLGNLILACHSGGGLPMRQLATGGDRAAAAVRECWGFDCLYNRGDAEIWGDWARRRPRARLYIRHLSGTATQSTALRQQGLPNVSVARSPARNHDFVPIAHWAERIRAAPFLEPR